MNLDDYKPTPADRDTWTHSPISCELCMGYPNPNSCAGCKYYNRYFGPGDFSEDDDLDWDLISAPWLD